MRFVYALVAAASVLTGYFAYKPAQFLLVKQVASNGYHDLFIEKDVHIAGLRSLRPDSIRKLLPLEQSVLWWSLNGSIIEAALEKHPFIKEASVERCSAADLRCFNVSLIERTPAYLSLYGSEAAVLGDDGATIDTASPLELEQKLSRLVSPSARPPIVIVGLVTPGLSTDITQARFRYINRSVGIIERGAAVQVTRIEVLSNGELLVRLKGKGFDVRFDDTSSDAERLEDEVTRLAKLLPVLRDREEGVARIDLAFNKMAVVTRR